MFWINLQLFGGRGGGSGMGGGGAYSDMRGVGYEGNPTPADEYDAAILQNLVELRERWGRRIGSNDPKDHLVGSYVIQEIKNGKVSRENFIGTQMQLKDELNRRSENNGQDIRSSGSRYSVTAWENAHAYADAGGGKSLDKILNGPELREMWKKAKTPY